MMKKLLSVLLLVAAVAGVCQAKEMLTKNFTVSARVTDLEVSQGIAVVYTQGSPAAMKVTATPELMKRLRVENDGSKLSIGLESGDLKDKSINYSQSARHGEVTVWLTAPSIDDFEASTGAQIEISALLSGTGDYEFEASTGADITVKDITADRITAESSTGASVKIDGIKASTVKADSSTGASLTLGGKADSVSFEASTGADIKAGTLIAGQGSADSSVGGSVKCNVKSLSTSTSIGGSVKNLAD